MVLERELVVQVVQDLSEGGFTAAKRGRQVVRQAQMMAVVGST